jgi:hypothetical protein
VLWTCPAQRCSDEAVAEACAAVSEAARTLSRRLGYAADEAKVGT